MCRQLATDILFPYKKVANIPRENKLHKNGNQNNPYMKENISRRNHSSKIQHFIEYKEQ